MEGRLSEDAFDVYVILPSHNTVVTAKSHKFHEYVAKLCTIVREALLENIKFILLFLYYA